MEGGTKGGEMWGCEEELGNVWESVWGDLEGVGKCVGVWESYGWGSWNRESWGWGQVRYGWGRGVGGLGESESGRGVGWLGLGRLVGVG